MKLSFSDANKKWIVYQTVSKINWRLFNFMKYLNETLPNQTTSHRVWQFHTILIKKFNTFGWKLPLSPILLAISQNWLNLLPLICRGYKNWDLNRAPRFYYKDWSPELKLDKANKTYLVNHKILEKTKI